MSERAGSVRDARFLSGADLGRQIDYAGILVGTIVSIEHVDDITDCEACVRIVADTAEGRRSAMLWQNDAVTITGADG